VPAHPLETKPGAPTRLGRYELIGHLATGGMAEIHLARRSGDAGFEQTVVVKRLLPELVASPAYVAMFLDEGKLVARLDHPNICEVYEQGKDGAEYYLAMPYLDGVSVQELIAQPRDPDRIAELRVAAGVIAQACAGLHHAHELRDADGAPAGLVHRDVSPSNLFVTAGGAVKVLDFGVAKVRGASETEAGTIKGKQQYMAPEQLLGEPLDRRCDVFALGIVLFELATHQRLFKRASEYLTARATLEEPIPRADAIDPAIPAALADVIARALARDRAGRYADADALARALEAAMAPHDGLAGAVEIAAAVAGTEELTAKRTRQARVLGEARAREPARAGADAESADADAETAGAGADAELAGADAGTAGAPARRPGASAKVGADGGVGGADAAGAADKAERSKLMTPEVQPPAATPPPRASAQIWRWMPAAASAGVAGAVVALVLALGARPGGSGGASVSSGGERAAGAAASAPAAESTVAAPAASGWLNVESTPPARIFVDGIELGTTPLVDRPLQPGRHELRAVLSDGRTKTLAIDVPAGSAAPPVRLAGW